LRRFEHQESSLKKYYRSIGLNVSMQLCSVMIAYGMFMDNH